MSISNNERKAIVKICEAIKEHKNFLLTTHQLPDGDGLGCELAFLRILKKLGKNVVVMNEMPSSKIYSFLPGYSEIFTPDSYSKEILTPDVSIFFDCSTKQRVGKVVSFIKDSLLINIDHHTGNSFFGDINLVCEKRSSVGEICFFIASRLACIDKDIAECLYVSILTDTGSFRYNFNSETLSVITRLLKTGINPEEIADNVYNNNPVETLLLLGHALVNLQFDPEFHIAWTILNQSIFKKTKAAEQDSEIVIDILRTIEKTDFVFLVKERETEIKFSLRSRKRCNVRKIAEYFGGGGHDNAAGFSLKNIPLDEAVRKFLRYLRENKDSLCADGLTKV
ncbi:MAG: bifunctional oligoribonuclease/PAP phosphatase NrnA [Candidatus Omnitrophica bacterium]|nr:bifunctional oligoribonuclease/PAP phosphatase NrnA [Candidatus Omnitrophota bacterium]